MKFYWTRNELFFEGEYWEFEKHLWSVNYKYFQFHLCTYVNDINIHLNVFLFFFISTGQKFVMFPDNYSMDSYNNESLERKDKKFLTKPFEWRYKGIAGVIHIYHYAKFK